MKRKSIVIFGILALLVVIRYETVNAESFPWRSREDCIKNFDIQRIDLNKEHWKDYQNILSNYFICRAIASNNIEECDNLTYEPAHERCLRTFRRYMAWVELIKKGSISPELRSAHPSIDKYYKKFITAFKSKDDKICDSEEYPQHCKAIINLDEELAPDWRTENYVIFMKAIKNSDVYQCHKFNEREMGGITAQACEALITGNLNACQQCKGVEEFRDNYCDWLGRKIEEE